MIEEDNCQYFPLGTEDRKEIEGFFDATDKKYIVSKDRNKKNKTILFWREKDILKKLDEKTIENFKNYFKKIGLKRN